MPLVSVIIPIYNTERFLPKCIESVLAQTLSDIEIILIDDGSTDNSGKICDSYACKDKRIHVTHTPNHGVSSVGQLADNLKAIDNTAFSAEELKNIYQIVK